MENITRAAFDVQYGLFKVSAFLVDLIHPVQWYHCSSNGHYFCVSYLTHVTKLVECWFANIFILMSQTQLLWWNSYYILVSIALQFG